MFHQHFNIHTESTRLSLPSWVLSTKLFVFVLLLGFRKDPNQAMRCIVLTFEWAKTSPCMPFNFWARARWNDRARERKKERKTLTFKPHSARAAQVSYGSLRSHCLNLSGLAGLFGTSLTWSAIQAGSAMFHRVNNVSKRLNNCTFLGPGHFYWSSSWFKNFLENFSLSSKNYVSSLIRESRKVASDIRSIT